MSFALAFSLALTPPTVAQEASDFTEPRSGIAFPLSLLPPGGGAAQHLVGTGIRTRTIFRIKVYALGLYVDSEAARRALPAFAGISRANLERDARFYRSLLEMKFGMTVRLVMTRNVSGQDVANSFEDALRPRLDQAAAETAMPGASNSLEEFRSNLNLDEIPKGAEIVFSCNPGGRLETSVEGSRRPSIEAPALCWALFDVYLGEKPISKGAKQTLIAGFPGLLGDLRHYP